MFEFFLYIFESFESFENFLLLIEFLKQVLRHFKLLKPLNIHMYIIYC